MSDYGATNALDFSGNINGTIGSQVTLNLSGKHSFAMNFTGNSNINSIINISNNSVWQKSSTSAWYISYWFNTGQGLSTHVAWTISSAVEGQPYNQFGFFQNNVQTLQTNGIADLTVGGASRADNAWHHLAIIVNDSATTITVFVDSAQVGQVTNAYWGGAMTLAKFMLGAERNLGPYGWQGLFDDLRISTTLKDANWVQMEANYTATLGASSQRDVTAPASIVTAAPTLANNSWTAFNWSMTNFTFIETNPDNCLLQYEYSNGTKTNQTMTRQGSTCNLNVTSLPEGINLYTAYVADSDDNIGISSTYAVRVDTLLPSSIVTAAPTLANNSGVSITQTNWLEINFTFTETNPNNCLLQLNYANGTFTNQTMARSGNTCYVNISSLNTLGVYNYTVYVNDSTGNLNSKGNYYAKIYNGTFSVVNPFSATTFAFNCSVKTDANKLIEPANQNATLGFWNFTNRGSTLLNITMALNVSPTTLIVKTNSTVDATLVTVNNISNSNATIASNLAVGASINVWEWINCTSTASAGRYAIRHKFFSKMSDSSG